MGKARLIKQSEQAATVETPSTPKPAPIQSVVSTVKGWVKEINNTEARNPKQQFAALFAQPQAD
jgi:hypothetical protein